MKISTNAGDEGGHGDTERSDKADDVINPRACADRGDDAERNGNHQRQQHGDEGQFEGGRKPLTQIAADKLPRHQRTAEIADRYVLEIAGELFE